MNLLPLGRITTASEKCFFYKKKWPSPASFSIHFHSFQTIYRIKTVDFSRIRTRIVGVEGEQADHLTIPLPRVSSSIDWISIFILKSRCKRTLTTERWNFRIAMLLWNKALWLSIKSHMTSFNQSDCIIQYSSVAIYATLKFIYDIG